MTGYGKKIVILLLFLLLPSVAINALEVSDGKIKLILHNDIGRFSIYYLIDEEKGKYTPLFVDQDPRTTTFSVVVNNKVYRLGDSFSFKESMSATDTGAMFMWKSSQLEVKQEFTFTQSLTSLVTDGLLITFTFTNNSDKDIEVGARFIIDTNMGEDSSSHFLTSGSKVTKETVLEEDDMIEHWISTRDEVTGLMVTTKGIDVTTPDKIIFANWKRLNDTSWSYTASSSRNFNLAPYSINDSAVCHYYYPKPISAGLSSEIALIMGNYSEDGYTIQSIRNTTTSTPKPAATTTAIKTPLETGAASTTSALVITSVKNDISTLTTVLEEIDKKIAAGELSEKDIELIEKIIAELKSKAAGYSQGQ